MTAVELLERMGADASANTLDARERFWSLTKLTEEQIKNNKLWCLVVPEKDDDEDDDTDREANVILN